jgi:hypothetical protein
MNISIYKNIYDKNSTITKGIEEILYDIKNGKWQDHFLKVSSEQDKKKRGELKEKAPCFTGSGKFKDGRNDSDLVEHSGFIFLDIDDVDDVNEAKAKLCADKYVYACFHSISGRGLCVVVKIDGKKHSDAFDGLFEYIYNNYELRLDPSGRNVSRLRYVTFDPHLFHNPESLKFKEYVIKPKLPKKQTSYLFVNSQFEKIVASVTSDICGSYTGWFEVGCSIASKYGDNGINYFRHISQYRNSSKKNFEIEIDKQYNHCVKSHYGYTISTFYHYLKLAGYEIKDKEIDLVARTAYFAKQRGNIYIGTSNVFRDPLQSQLEQKEIFLLPNRATFLHLH